MAHITIGSTGLTVEKTGFGALPIQRVSVQEATGILRKAFDNGISYFDTARMYSDSEEKLGIAFEGIRDKLILATKTGCHTVEQFWSDLEQSLRMLKTDYIDVYQFHNPDFCPLPGDGSGLYEAMLQARQQGKIRFISITNHRLDVATQAVESGLYATLQFPFNYLCTQNELDLLEKVKQAGMGFICMKGMSGGLITNARASAAWMNQFPEVLPIWGIQRERELDEFLSFIPEPPVLTPELQAVIDSDRAQLQGEFCRGCGYCMPCPQGIIINQAARISLMIRRAPEQNSLNEQSRKMMEQVASCVECYQCASKCPYGLDTPQLLKRNYRDYQEILAGKPIEPHNF